MNPKNISSAILLFGLLSVLIPPVSVEAQAPRKAQIVFSSDRDRDLEIYVMNTDGKNPRNLTNHPASDFAPAWSPDGRKNRVCIKKARREFRYLRDGCEGRKCSKTHESS